MGFFRSIFKNFLDVPSWIGLNNLKQQTSFLYKTVLTILKPKTRTTTRKTDFKEAAYRFNVTEQDLENIKKRYFYYTVFYITIGSLCIIYTIYLFFHKHLFSGIVMILISTIIFLKAFSNHFWYFEIQNRKLGCTIKEWLNGKIDNEND